MAWNQFTNINRLKCFINKILSTITKYFLNRNLFNILLPLGVSCLFSFLQQGQQYVVLQINKNSKYFLSLFVSKFPATLIQSFYPISCIPLVFGA